MSDRKSATKRAAEATTPLEIDDGGALTAGVRELRDHLSRYLDEVKAGRSVTVTDHGTVIATIVPMRFSERTMQLYREGRVELPTLPKRPIDDFKRVHVEGGIEDILREVRGG
jgi:prevent-host-death family protein